MAAEQLGGEHIRAEVENIGGIDETTVTLPPGVSILTGKNATNRTSFLTAMVAEFGSDRASLKGDADHGSVTIEIAHLVVALLPEDAAALSEEYAYVTNID